MNKLYIITILLFVLSSCVENDYYHNPFKYDKITHYSVTLDEDEIDAYYQSISGIIDKDTTKVTPQFNKDLFEIVYEHNKISLLSDVATINKLAEIGFIKREIPSNNYASIDSTFQFNNTEFSEGYACTPIYRDILVFEQGRKISGWAKYCFECNKHDFIGADYIYQFKPYSIDYDRLEQILNLTNNAHRSK